MVEGKDEEEGMKQIIAYIILCFIFLISFILTCSVLFFAKRSSIHNSFIFKLITNLIIVATIHSFSYTLNYVEKGENKFWDFLCTLQSIMLISFCQIQEVWVILITIISFKGIIKNQLYIQKEKKRYYLILIFVYIVIPAAILIPYGVNGALGKHDTYCWVNKENENETIFSGILFVLKNLYIMINVVIIIIMFVGVYLDKNNSNDYDKRMKFCLKTGVFVIIQLIINIPMTIIRLSKTIDINIGSFISSSSGIFYPIYIAWYTEIICSKKKESSETKDTLEPQDNIMETTLALMNEDVHLNDSIDYYS